jgi:hypothetical protein
VISDVVVVPRRRRQTGERPKQYYPSTSEAIKQRVTGHGPEKKKQKKSRTVRKNYLYYASADSPALVGSQRPRDP